MPSGSGAIRRPSGVTICTSRLAGSRATVVEDDHPFAIAIPTHNRRDTVLLAARSALGQTRPLDQLLVLCDGCSVGTPEALRGLGAAQLKAIESPKGIGYAYKRQPIPGTSRGRGSHLADDDLLMPDHLERIGELWNTGRYDLVQCHGVVVQPDDRLEAFGAD